MVYYKNDERAKIKRMINKSFGSEIIEENRTLSTAYSLMLASDTDSLLTKL